jgi:WD40 repeat protein
MIARRSSNWAAMGKGIKPQPASPAHLLALPDGTELIGEFRIRRVLGAGGFGITYLANETALARDVTIKEYFPVDYAARGESWNVAPRSRDSTKDYQWGLERFMEEAQTLARFTHPNIVRVYRCFRARDTGYMVLHFEEGGSFKAWLKGLERAPRQGELDRIVAPLLDALELVHSGDYLHRDIAPDNIIIRRDGAPVLIDFGSARGEIATHSKTVSALVKPGYSPYEQYATTTSKQGPWTDIYALGATLYHAIAGRRPPDAPSRMVNDEYRPAGETALSSYRPGFLAAIDRALRLDIGERPQSIVEWRGTLLSPSPRRAGAHSLRKALDALVSAPPEAAEPAATAGAGASPAPASALPPAAEPRGQLLDFLAARKRRAQARSAKKAPQAAAPAPPPQPAVPGRGSADAVAQPQASPARPAAVAAAKAVAAPARRSAAALRSPPRPRRRRIWRIPSRPLRVLGYKLLIGLGIASLAVAYQQSLPRVEGRGGSVVASQSAELTTVLRLAGHKGAVTGIATADQGRWIVSVGADATLRVWNSGSGALVRTIELDDGPATALAVDERRALTGHKSGAIALWDLERAEKLSVFQGEAGITGLAFASGAAMIAAATQAGGLSLFDATTPSALPTVLEAGEGAPQLMAAARGGELLAASSADGLKLWRLATRGVQRVLRSRGEAVSALAIGDDGRAIAAGAPTGSVRIFSTSRHQRLFRAHAGGVTALAFAPGERLLASAGSEGLVKLWDVHGGRPQRVMRGPAGAVAAIAFSGDGRRIASAGEDGIIHVLASEPALAGR